MSEQDPSGKSDQLTRAEFLRIAGLSSAGAVATILGLKGLADWAERKDEEDLAKQQVPESEPSSTPQPSSTPKPTLTPETKSTPVPFGPPETGRYNAEALKSWAEIEQQPKLDPRLGISILPSRVVRGSETVSWHNRVAEKLGFQRVAMVISPQEHQNHTGLETPFGMTMTQVAKEYGYEQILANPAFKSVHITCDVGSPEAGNGWQVRVGEYTEAQLQATYQEHREFAEYLLTNFGDKDITVGPLNEMELLCKGGYSPDTEDDDISDRALRNAIAYYNTAHQAIRDANEAHSDKAPLKTGLEVLQIMNSFKRDGAQNGLNVVAGLNQPPDELTLSAWQFAGKGSEPGWWMKMAVGKMKEASPQSQIAITEHDIADGDRPDLSRDQIARLVMADTEAALANGAAYVIHWGLTGFDSKEGQNFVGPDQMRGLGLIRSDGSCRKEVYNGMRAFSGVGPVA